MPRITLTCLVVVTGVLDAMIGDEEKPEADPTEELRPEAELVGPGSNLPRAEAHQVRQNPKEQSHHFPHLTTSSILTPCNRFGKQE